MFEKLILRLLFDELGATAIEYGLICGLLVIAIVSALSGFADANLETWTTISNETHNAVESATRG